MSQYRRAKGDDRKTETARARIPPSLADRLDRACVALREPPSEFMRKAIEERVQAVETGKLAT